MILTDLHTEGIERKILSSQTKPVSSLDELKALSAGEIIGFVPRFKGEYAENYYDEYYDGKNCRRIYGSPDTLPHMYNAIYIPITAQLVQAVYAKISERNKEFCTLKELPERHQHIFIIQESHYALAGRLFEPWERVKNLIAKDEQLSFEEGIVSAECDHDYKRITIERIGSNKQDYHVRIYENFIFQNINCERPKEGIWEIDTLYTSLQLIFKVGGPRFTASWTD